MNRFHQPDDAVGEVVFHVGDAQQVLPENAGCACARRAPADDELDVVQRNVRKRKPRHGGDLHLCGAADSADAQPERRRLQSQPEPRRGLGREHAVEGTAVDQHRPARAVERHRHQRPQPREGDRQLGELLQNTARRSPRRRARRCGQHQQQQPQQTGAAPAPRRAPGRAPRRQPRRLAAGARTVIAHEAAPPAGPRPHPCDRRRR